MWTSWRESLYIGPTCNAVAMTLVVLDIRNTCVGIVYHDGNNNYVKQVFAYFTML